MASDGFGHLDWVAKDRNWVTAVTRFGGESQASLAGAGDVSGDDAAADADLFRPDGAVNMGRLTDRARKALAFAAKAADLGGWPGWSTGHLLYALLNDRAGVAKAVLATEFGLADDHVARYLHLLDDRVKAGAGGGPPGRTGALEALPGATLALTNAAEAARGLRHRYIGTEHLLLGVANSPSSLGVILLATLAVGAPDVVVRTRGYICPERVLDADRRALAATHLGALDLALRGLRLVAGTVDGMSGTLAWIEAGAQTARGLIDPPQPPAGAALVYHGDYRGDPPYCRSRLDALDLLAAGRPVVATVAGLVEAAQADTLRQAAEFDVETLMTAVAWERDPVSAAGPPAAPA